MRVRIVVPSGVEGPGGLACNQRRAVAALFATRPRLVSRCRVHDGVVSETRRSPQPRILGKGLVVPNPYATPCRFRRAAHDSGPRQASSIRQIVVHSTEGGTAASVAAFFAT